MKQRRNIDNTETLLHFYIIEARLMEESIVKLGEILCQSATGRAEMHQLQTTGCSWNYQAYEDVS